MGLDGLVNYVGRNDIAPMGLNGGGDFVLHRYRPDGAGGCN